MKIFLGQFPLRKIAPNPKTNPNPTLTLTRTPTLHGGQFSSGDIARIPYRKSSLFAKYNYFKNVMISSFGGPIYNLSHYIQKQPSRSVFRKRCFEICSKFTGEHPCRNAISIKLLANKFAACFQNNFSLEHLWRAASLF